MSTQLTNDVKNLLTGLSDGVDPIPVNVDGYNSLKNSFNSYLSDAKNNFLQYFDWSDYPLTSKIDELNNPNLVIDGDAGIDMLLVDNYRVNSINDMNIDAATFKDKNGKDVVGFKVTIKDSKGKTHTYNLVNVEKIRFIDAAGVMQEVDVKTGKLSLNKTTSELPTNAGYHYNLQEEWGISKFGDKNDVAELDGKGVSINTGKGDDTVRVNSLGKASNPDQVNGGDGNDTIEFMNLTEADIKSITYNEKTANYTLTDKNGGVVQFKRFEKIKIGNNTYNITRDEASLTLEKRFINGSVHFGTGDSGLLNSPGLKLGNNNDYVTIDTVNALNPKGASQISGGAGFDTLDLHALGAAKLTAWSEKGGIYTLNFDFNGVTRTIQVNNIEKIRLNVGGQDKTINVDKSGLDSLTSKTETPDGPTTNYKTIDGVNYYSFYDLAINNATIAFGLADSDKAATEIVTLEGKYSDYTFEIAELYDNNNKPIPGIVITDKKTGYQMYLNNGIDGVQFKKEAGSPTYYLIGDDGKMFGGDTKFADSQYKKLTIYSSDKPSVDYLNALAGNDLIYSSDGADDLFGGNGDDTFFAMKDKDKADVDYYNGGLGTDTLDLTGLGVTTLKSWSYDAAKNEYTLTIINDKVESKVVTKDIEKLKINTKGDIKTVDVNAKGLGSISTPANNPPNDETPKINTIKPSTLKWGNENTDYFKIPVTVSGGADLDLLELDGDIFDYEMVYLNAEGNNPESIIIIRQSDNSVIRVAGIDAMKFSNMGPYRVLNIESQPFGNINIDEKKYKNTYNQYISFDPEANKLSKLTGYNSSNVYYGTDVTDNIVGGDGDDYFFESDIEDDEFDTYDGGGGTNTFVLSGDIKNYKITLENGFYVIADKNDEGTKTVLKNIQKISYPLSTGQRITIKIEDLKKN